MPAPRKAGIECAPIHGNRNQNQRASALRRFADGEVGVLVATDVLARGIDIPNVAYVVNLDVPSDAEDYIHRIGRTGRAGEYGWALTFATPEEEFDLRDIEQLMGKNIPVYPRAQGIPLGEKPLVLDPNRTPADRLPGKEAMQSLWTSDERSVWPAPPADCGEPLQRTSARRNQNQASKASWQSRAPSRPRSPMGRRRSKAAPSSVLRQRDETSRQGRQTKGRRTPATTAGMPRRC